MFAKPEWFRLKNSGRGLRPVTWQGWTYAFTWMAALSAPFLALISLQLVLESFVWLAASMSFLVWDVRQTAKAIRSAEDSNVLYISDDDAPSVTTRNYDFRLRE